MKRILSFFIAAIALLLVGCTKILPLDNPEPELFSTFHEGDDFTILKRIDIDPNQIYYCIGLIINSPKGYTCLVGEYERLNYLVLFEDEYYDIINGSYLNLYTANELIDWGINAGCHLDE
ncbi:MAG: hypothetical protein CVV57_10895 [Tenericutes bacterium HGW-Tenericutes-2]|nr:MAG: hypothetical protein CVV58_00020 [Tenericutes bacterium HGW-Tenericutes-3]PKK97717.1 MAG: hypothetical protein CVV57_10895 [Tenericutes bacterium HGW-Tenericutes-2]